MAQALPGQADDKVSTINSITGVTPPSENAIGAVEDYKNLDDAILRAQGHESVLKRSFSLLSSLGLAFDITNSWVGVVSNFGQNLKYGGPQLAVFSVVVACFVQWIVTLGLSELASAFPSSGGQYHFVFIVAPQKSRRFGAFVTGWMSIFGWWFGTCSGLSLVASSILGLASFLHPEFAPQQWHTYLVYLAILVITVLPLFVCPKWLPRFSIGALALTITGFFTWFVVILAARSHSNSGAYITHSGLGTSGWGPGPAWILSIINSMYAFTGTDGAIHIAEEMHRPGVRLPQIMNMTMLIGLLTAFPLVLAFMFSMTDMTSVMNANWPAVELLYQVTGSKACTITLTVLLIVIYASNIPPQWVASGRLAWAFARDNGTPFPKYFSYVDPVLEFPTRTTIAACVFGTLYGLIYLASTTAFNSIITSAVLFLNISYAIPQGIMVFQGRSKVLPDRPLNLGKWGYFCNIYAPLWITVMTVMVCFPPSLPAEVSSMNYTAPIIVGLFILIIIFWFVIGKRFEGPHIDWDLLSKSNAQETEIAKHHHLHHHGHENTELIVT